ncbi:hypothetical protein CJJ23_02845 [Mycoplasmopsis agassizii]|uniref:ABC transporter substrate-binding protein n=1 Tax=Mycoplasmopsis agassizii TaxID=33922 RepID=A0A269TIM7_9BACT|nr:hypothetical protein [Mycoplasmopsis agassizii]PAK21261.1 hypothetical protein CJJ23_02845 [Mycoplasmopsis agassizii]
MKLSKKLILSSSAFAALAAGALAVACSTNPGTGDAPEVTGTLKEKAEKTLSNWSGTLKVAYEESWKKALDKAITLLPENMRNRVELVKVANGGAIEYVNTTVTNQGATAADLFPVQLDKFQDLINKQLVAAVDESSLTDYGDNKKLVKIENTYYGFPLNVESVIAFYNKDVYPNGPGDITTEFKDPVGKKFAFQAGNLWHGSTFLNGLFADQKNGNLEEAKNMWVTYNGTTKTAPFLTDEQSKQTLKELWTYVNALRTSTNENYKIVANSSANREKTIRSGIADQSISLTIEGPWILSDLVASVLKNNKSTPEKATEILSKISASVLPKYGTRQLRHFIGGWAYSLNKASLASFSKEAKAIDGKAHFANYFANVLTSKDLATEWMTEAGKMSAATGAVVNMDVKTLEFNDPTNDKAPKIKTTEYIGTTGFAEAVNNLYKAVIDSVSKQSSLNLEQPKWPGKQYWEPYDALGLTTATYTTADAFLEAFTKNIELQLK